MEAEERSGPLSMVASMMAIYLQTQECKCVRALVDAVRDSSRYVGGIIYDGLLVEREGDEVTLPETLLMEWACSRTRC
jgi:hypothetical protein